MISRGTRFVLFFYFLIVWAAIPASAHADGVSEEDTSDQRPLDLNWHGFISQGFFKTSANNYLGDSQEGSFDFTEVGLNVTKTLTKNIDVGAQIFSQKLGPNENFNVKFDWFYANYQYSNWFKFKVGRIKIPFGLYNEQSDIDSARVPILLPQSIYPEQNRNYLLAQNGVQLYGFGDLGKLGSLDYHFYAGSINVDIPPATSSTEVITQINIPHLLGGRLLWETPLDGLKAAITLQKLTADIDLTLDGFPIAGTLPVTQWIASLEYSVHRLTLASEYAREYVTVQSDSPLIPGSSEISEQWYALANYQLTDSFAPGVYYSMLTPNIMDRGAHEKRQGDLALYFRYDFNSHWLIKLEGHLMNGTAGLDTALNNNQSLSSLNDNWQMVLLKTTVSF